MRIAVAYDNGQVFQHFGRTEQFKIYEIEGGEIVGSSILDCGDYGHEALAELLFNNDVSLVICGGMGPGAENALSMAGILNCTGAEGDADEAVAAFLRGELETKGINCNEHDGEEGGCGGSCGGGCGSGCGGCRPQITLEGKNAGKNCKVHYRGTFDDGTQFDSSYDRGEPIEFVCGAGMMIKGFDKAVVNMEIGEKVSVHLMPEEAYGMPDPNAVFSVPIKELPGAEELSVGEQVYLTNMMGQPFRVTVSDLNEDTITFDANHEMAGKELNFDIELVEVTE